LRIRLLGILVPLLVSAGLSLGCSRTIDLNLLSSGCAEGQITCNGECMSLLSCEGGAGAASGTGGGGTSAAGQAGQSGEGAGGDPAHQVEVEPCLIVQRFTYRSDASVSSVHLSGTMNDWAEPGDELERDDDGAFTIDVPLRPGEYVYKFVVDGTLWLADQNAFGSVGDGYGGVNSLVSVYPTEDSEFEGDCDLSCFDDADFGWQDAVMYSVFPDRYVDSDGLGSEPSSDGSATNPRWGWGGGDLPGLTAKLPYLADLGVSLIWLGPPQKAGEGGYHGYWPVRDDSDPEADIEERFGTANDLKTFVDTAHATTSANGSNIKVLLDYVANHVHDSSPMAQAHPDWFFLEDGAPVLCDGGTPSPGDDLWDDPVWTTRCSFSSFLWKFDYENSEAALEWSIADMRYWIDAYGFDAFRIDAARHQPVKWMERMREAMDEVRVSGDLKPYLMGETFSYDPAVVARDVDPQKRFDGQLDFPVRKHLCEGLLSQSTKLSGTAYQLALSSTLHPDHSLMATWLGNHDIPRQIHYASGEIGSCTTGSYSENNEAFQFDQPEGAEPYQRLELGFVALLTNPGLPVIYAGDEIGLAGGGDPENRRMMEWWEDELKPAQKKLRSAVQTLANLRGQNRALSRGARRTFSADDDTWVYERIGCGAASGFVIAINRGLMAATLELPPGEYAELSAADSADWSGGATVMLGPGGYAVLRRD
jgi:glycosidase